MSETDRQLATIQATLDLLLKQRLPKKQINTNRAQRVRLIADEIHNTKRKPA